MAFAMAEAEPSEIQMRLRDKTRGGIANIAANAKCDGGSREED